MLLTSRVDPRLPVSRWRGRSWLAELRQRDLALTLPETAELFTALGEHRLAASEVERLWRHTEGWVAGLRLAAAGVKDRADVSAAVAEFSGRTPMVADLLADELLRRAPKELSEFLLRTSVADVLDAELCDALSGRGDSGEVLRRMEADLKFVMATGPGRDTWRYHPLLAEMLRSELQAHRPDEAPGSIAGPPGSCRRGATSPARPAACWPPVIPTGPSRSCSRRRTAGLTCPISRASWPSSTCSRASW